MKKYLFILITITLTQPIFAQGVMTPELLWSLGRVSGAFLYNNGNSICYNVTTYNISTGKRANFISSIGIDGKNITSVSQGKPGDNPILLSDNGILYTSDGKLASTTSVPKVPEQAENLLFNAKTGNALWSQSVKIDATASDLYPEYATTTARIYDDLMYRHWTQWADGTYNHIFVGVKQADGTYKATDIMAKEPYDSPTKPFGGSDDYAWHPDGQMLAYVATKKVGKDYATSTNSDIYFYNIANGQTTNFTVGMMGYDKSPAFSSDGKRFAWSSMPRDGYEADKVSIWVADLKSGKKFNLFQDWDGTVSSFTWANTSDKIYFSAPLNGLVSLFEAKLITNKEGNISTQIKQLTKDEHDYSGIIGIASNGNIIAQRTDFNHAAELYSINPNNGEIIQLTHVNDDLYKTVKMSKVEKKMIKTTDGKDMLTWVIYPPDFDPAKKYPALLYCQGGPQSALSQFYSFRWNMQLMAANGYIVIAPNRRGMPGYGQAWNEAISGDWGGQPIRDYLSATDALAAEPYVDKDRMGAVGASYGGYSVYMLAGKHQKRFKTFIAHCGLFNMESWYGATEELWFANFDLKGPYWQKPQPKSYTEFNPINYVAQWDTPIMIIEGEKDFRVPYEQGLEAFQAAQLKGLKSRLLIYPDEGHWVTKPYNSLVWHHEFFRWLRETL